MKRDDIDHIEPDVVVVVVGTKVSFEWYSRIRSFPQNIISVYYTHTENFF